MDILTKYKQKSSFRNILWISIIYLLAHGFLLVATGRWWDDWVYADKNWDYLFEVMMQSSVPLTAFLDGSNWLFPDGFYRILVFIWYYLTTIIFYKILRKIDIFDIEACVWITILFSVIPVNDARIMWIIYPYAVGFTLFFLGFYIAIANTNIKSRKKITRRIISIILLMLAYGFIESIMTMTIPLVCCLYYEELKTGWNWKNIKINIRKLLLAVIHNIDYLLAPIIWYFGDKLLFPGYGAYGGHSYVPWFKLGEIILHSPINAFHTFASIIASYQELISNYIVIGIVFLILIIYVITVSLKYLNNRGTIFISNEGFLKNVLMTFLGIVIFFIGFFPYAIKRNAPISTTYCGGRDAVLLGIGTAIMFYYGACTVFKEQISKAVVLVLIVLGVIHFNYKYFDWQESYYQQLQLQHEIAQNDDIKNNDTFLIMYKGDLICSNFYQTNGNSWAATGEETRYYMPGTESLSGLIDMDDETWYLNAYMMNEYEYGDKVIDGIIFVDYSDIRRRTLVRQKINELFSKEKFNSWIDEIKNIKYVPITKAESDKLLELYSAGKLYDATIYEMYYDDYF